MYCLWHRLRPDLHQVKGTTNAMADPSSWRDVLKSIIKNPRERDRLATELRLNALTLTRWSTGDSQPRPHNLRQLQRALSPELRDQFAALVQQEDTSFRDEAPPELVRHL